MRTKTFIVSDVITVKYVFHFIGAQVVYVFGDRRVASATEPFPWRHLGLPSAGKQVCFLGAAQRRRPTDSRSKHHNSQRRPNYCCCCCCCQNPSIINCTLTGRLCLLAASASHTSAPFCAGSRMFKPKTKG